MSIKVIKPGLLTTVQDLGRFGYQKYGVITSGAMDSFALRVANLLVQNEEGEAGLEMTMLGPSLYFEEDTLIAICGADLSATIKDKKVPLWQAIIVRGGNILKFNQPKRGSRSYLAVAGGFALEREMGSRSTYLRAELGGFRGRVLKAEDVLHKREPNECVMRQVSFLAKTDEDLFFPVTRPVSQYVLPNYTQEPLIRVTKGAHHHLFDRASQQRFYTDPYHISPQSDRMGYRLTGTSLQLEKPVDLVSEAVMFGTIQVPADGQPIVLMADCQTTGGYPKIAQVITTDLAVLAQVRVGGTIRFHELSLAEAQRRYLEREKEIEWLKAGIMLEYKEVPIDA